MRQDKETVKDNLIALIYLKQKFSRDNNLPYGDILSSYNKLGLVLDILNCGDY